ncbi:MAG: cation-translocating P-type ATPase [Candidatus Bathyarchaeia archaeon]
MSSKVWHSETPENVLNELKTTQNGLTTQEAQKRLATYGPNELKKEKGKSALKILLGQFTDILMIILLIATGLSIVVGEVTDAIIILIIVVASAGLGFSQEYRSEKAVEALKKMTAPTASVLRDGKEVRIPAAELVPGDIMVLYAGDKVAADGRLIEAFTMKDDEAPLTGESNPVQKSAETLPEATQLNDRENMVYTGTVVVYGRGKAAVTNTGMTTEFGKIAQMVQSAPAEQTPLEKRLSGVGKWIGILCLSVAASVGIIGIIEGREILDMVLWAVSLAVAAVPEALPAIVTGALAIGMYRMAKSNAIVKRLPAVETLGSTSVICSDKTGTMTKGEMTVRSMYVNGQTFKVTGIGYAPEGEFQVDDKKVEPDDNVKELLKAATLCNDSGLEQDTQSGKWIVKGDPTEGALVVAAAKAGLNKETLEEESPRIYELPFSSERKRMTTIHRVAGKRIAYMKGAPEMVIERCSKIFLAGKEKAFNKEEQAKTVKLTEQLALQALRNLAVAYKELPDKDEEFTEAMEKDFVFMGIMSMIDPPRPEVKDAISICKKAGIRVVMITGDHKLTATAVGKELGLINEDGAQTQVLTGQELEKMSDEQLLEVVEKTAIYARVAPEHKVRIVKAWKAKDQVVAMTGDGVNDAPALKMSDIGVAMGISGTEVSKEAADMVLADDNFASIVKAVREGREIFENIKKYLTFLLQCNIMEIIVMLVAVLSVPYLANWLNPGSDATLVGNAAIALTAVQLLWMNLVTDGLPAIALGVDPGDPDLMERKPRKPNESIFSRDVKTYLIGMPILMSALLLAAFFMHAPWTSEFHLLEARTQLLTAMIVMELVVALCMRSLKYPLFKVGAFKNKYLWAAILSSFALQLVILYVPGLQILFDVHNPELIDWAVAALYGAIVFAVLELGKYVTSRKKRN